MTPIPGKDSSEMRVSNGTHSPSEECHDIVENGEPDCKHSKKMSNIARRSKYVLAICCVADFFSGVSFAIMAPFYPREAARKGMDTTTVGFIFSIFELIIFVTSPIIGNYLTKLGPKFTFLSGIFLGGFCTILFGTLNMSPPNAPFIAVSFATRSVQALGFSAYVTATFAIVSSEFSDRAAMTFGFLHTATSTGLMVGPAVGGVLYEVGGFGLPFYIIGSAVVLNGILAWKFLPEPYDLIRAKRERSIFVLGSNPMVIISMMSICFGAMGLTFLDPILVAHLEPFGMSTATVSLFFVIPPLVNSLTAPMWGYLTDVKNIQAPLLATGHFLFGIAFLVVGPSPLLPFIPFKLWVVAIGLIVVGVNFSCILITAMKCTIVGTLETGFDDTLDTYGIVAGIFNSMYTLGGFFGPMLGGILSDKFGNFVGFTVVGLINIAMLCIVCPYFLTRHRRKQLLLQKKTQKLEETIAVYQKQETYH